MNEQQYEKALDIIEQIMDAEPDTFEGQVLDLLADLCQEYEENNF